MTKSDNTVVKNAEVYMYYHFIQLVQKKAEKKADQIG